MKYPITQTSGVIYFDGLPKASKRYVTDHPRVLDIMTAHRKPRRNGEKGFIMLNILFIDETVEKFEAEPDVYDFDKAFLFIINKAERFLENHNSGTLKPLEDV